MSTSSLELRLVREGEGFSALPVIDGTPLTDLAHAVEAREGFSPSEGYQGVGVGGLEPQEIEAHFLPEDASLLVLECGSCGEWGCWPGEMTIELAGDTVTWRDLRNKHRPTWDYPGVGPFVFEREAYEAAIARLVAELEEQRG